MGSKTRGFQKLECVLSEDKINQYSQKLAENCIEKMRLEEEKRAISKEFNEKISVLVDDIDQKSHAVLTGSEISEVMCHWNLDRVRGKAECIREDTGEIIDIRDLVESEWQEDMFESVSHG